MIFYSHIVIWYSHNPGILVREMVDGSMEVKG